MNLTYTQDIVIDRLTGGIPQVIAKNKPDLYYGLGYCHAIDRGMQLMLMKMDISIFLIISIAVSANLHQGVNT